MLLIIIEVYCMCVLHVSMCLFKEVLPVQLGFLPLVILEFSFLPLTKGNEKPSSFPLLGPWPLIVDGVNKHECKCFTSDWKREQDCAYLHKQDIRCHL